MLERQLEELFRAAPEHGSVSMKESAEAVFIELTRERNRLVHEFSALALKSHGRHTSEFVRRQGPPGSAKFLLLLMPKKDRGSLLGDLEEEYRTYVLPEYGPAKARWWYWWQVIASI
jgi:hypothetical protein